MASSIFTDRDEDMAQALVEKLKETNQEVPEFLESYAGNGFNDSDCNYQMTGAGPGEDQAGADPWGAVENSTPAADTWGASATPPPDAWGAPAPAPAPVPSDPWGASASASAPRQADTWGAPAQAGW